MVTVPDVRARARQTAAAIGVGVSWELPDPPRDEDVVDDALDTEERPADDAGGRPASSSS